MAGFALGSLLLGLPFTAITLFAMQEARRLWPHNASALMALLTAAYGLGQIAGPPMVAWLLQHSASPAAGFATSLQTAAASLVLGAAPVPKVSESPSASTVAPAASGCARGSLRPQPASGARRPANPQAARAPQQPAPACFHRASLRAQARRRPARGPAGPSATGGHTRRRPARRRPPRDRPPRAAPAMSARPVAVTLAVLALALCIGGLWVAREFRRDMTEAYQRIQGRSQRVASPFGDIEFLRGGGSWSAPTEAAAG
jgi:hypothetical protein